MVKQEINLTSSVFIFYTVYMYTYLQKYFKMMCGNVAVLNITPGLGLSIVFGIEE